MTGKEQVLKLIEGRIDTIQTLAIESIELIYNAGYNEAIEEAARLFNEVRASADTIRKLKK